MKPSIGQRWHFKNIKGLEYIAELLEIKGDVFEARVVHLMEKSTYTIRGLGQVFLTSSLTIDGYKELVPGAIWTYLDGQDQPNY